MGTLHYGQSGFAIEMDDRALAHLKVAILTLLRSGKSIAFSYSHPSWAGSGRETLWITPTTDIRFHFLGGRAPRLNRAWIDAMLGLAAGPTGLAMIPEPADVPRLEPIGS